MDSVVNCAIGLIEKKMVLSEDLLILCFEYCNHVNDASSSLTKTLINAIQVACEDCLMFDDEKTSDGKKKKSKTIKNMSNEVKIMRKRNSEWFRECMLFNNIWLCQYGNDNNKKDDVKDDTDDKDHAREIATKLGGGVQAEEITRSESTETNFFEIEYTTYSYNV